MFHMWEHFCISSSVAGSTIQKPWTTAGEVWLSFPAPPTSLTLALAQCWLQVLYWFVVHNKLSVNSRYLSQKARDTKQQNLLVFLISGLTLEKYPWCFHCPEICVLTVFIYKLLTLTFTLPLTYIFAYPKMITSCFLFALISIDLPWILPIKLGRGQQYFSVAD